jgi:branched-chain amino acid transport system permease protein
MVDYLFHVLILIGIFSILGVTFNFVVGYGGIMSLAHAVFFGVGAYTSALLAIHWRLVYPVTLIGGIFLAGLTGAFFIVLLRKLRGDYLIIATLGLQLAVSNVFLNWKSVTHGDVGLVGIPRPEFLWFQIATKGSYLILTIILAAICFTIIWWLVSSPFGRTLRTIRDDEVGAQSLGKNIPSYRVTTFALSAAIAGIAGSLYGHYICYINPLDFTVHDSVMILIIVIFGGLGNIWGVIPGSIFLVALPEALRFIPMVSIYVPQLRIIFFSVALLLIIYFRPQGLLGERLLFSRPSGGEKPTKLDDPGSRLILQSQKLVSFLAEDKGKPQDSNRPVMKVLHLSKNFGGLKAVNDVSFAIMAGKDITGIIGPNGAGKTTLFDLICGYLSTEQGEVYIKEQNVTKLSPHEIARLGVGRVFQNLHLFGQMSTLDNVIAAMQKPSEDENLIGMFISAPTLYRQNKLYREKGNYILECLGLADRRNEMAGKLSYAEQKLLAIARLLASECDFFLLDELASGLDSSSMHALTKLLRGIAESGRTVCLVEHNLDFVRETVDNVLFLDQGRLIAEGRTEQIVSDKKLAQIYFGSVQ